MFYDLSRRRYNLRRTIFFKKIERKICYDFQSTCFLIIQQDICLQTVSMLYALCSMLTYSTDIINSKYWDDVQ